LERELRWKTLGVALEGLVKNLGFHSIDFCQVAIENDWTFPNCMNWKIKILYLLPPFLHGLHKP
jgi:hypothetical protein